MLPGFFRLQYMGKRQKQSAAGKEGLAAFSLSILSMAAAALAGKKEEEEWRLRDWSGERERERMKASFLLFPLSGFA